jgi:O-acetyl-ADP-ribose deacetylase (regulator of RNase III)
MERTKEKGINYTKGNLLDLAEKGEFDVIVHGCNCFHTMGAGIAGQIAKRYPNIYDIDKKLTEYGSVEKLGTLSYGVPTGYTFVVVNAYTQFQPGQNVNYHAIYSAMEKVRDKYCGKELRIGIPKIGAGIAGGDWDLISKHLRGIFSLNLLEELTVVEYDGK